MRFDVDNVIFSSALGTVSERTFPPLIRQKKLAKKPYLCLNFCHYGTESKMACF